MPVFKSPYLLSHNFETERWKIFFREHKMMTSTECIQMIEILYFQINI